MLLAPNTAGHVFTSTGTAVSNDAGSASPAWTAAIVGAGPAFDVTTSGGLYGALTIVITATYNSNASVWATVFNADGCVVGSFEKRFATASSSPQSSTAA